MIQLQNITLRRGAKVLLEGANLTLHSGEKVGLVGRNGAGKSTLFALFNGSLHEDVGDFSLPADWRIAQVTQHMPESEQGSTDFVLDGDERLSRLQAKLSAAEAAEDGMAIAQAHSDLQDAGVHDARARAQALILGLGFQPEQLQRPVNSFSGGWRMRLQLARTLMAPSDLLLLDEPTNHLDLDALVWLEGWLTRYAGTLIVISHDREFLDAVTCITVHIEHTHLQRYSGNYSAFEEQRVQQLMLQQATYARQQEKIAHLQKFIDRFKAKASKAKQAQSRVKSLERMEKVAPVLAEAEFQFEFKEPASLPNPMLVITDATFGYFFSPEAQNAACTITHGAPLAPIDAKLTPEDASSHIILRGVNCTVLAGQRIGILGANGQGKSTFVKTIAHTLPLLGGHVTEGKGLTVGYFAQHELDVLREQDTPLEHMMRLARKIDQENTEAAREQQLRNFLGTFCFPGEMATQPVGQFSGGEKARLVLAMIVWQRPNLLLLDEPTNHLDLSTRQALAVALNKFEGTLMLVSHDRALLRSVCDEFWLVACGSVQPFDGDLNEYQRFLLDEARRLRERVVSQNEHISAAAEPSQVTATAAAASNPAEQRRLQAQRRQAISQQTKPLKKALQQAEARMAEITQEREMLETRLSSSLAPSEIAESGKRLKGIAAELAKLEDDWLKLGEEIEALEKSGG